MGIGFLSAVLGSCVWVYWFSGGFAAVVCREALESVESADGVAFVDGKFAIGYTDDDFICATMDWWPPEKCDYGTCSWGHASILNLDLSNPILINAVREFSPIKLRIGGSLQDKVIYAVDDPEIKCVPFEKNTSQMFGFTEGCLSMSRWDELNRFFKKTRAVVIFGLNALNGRIHLKDGSCKGPWNSTNAAAFINYTVNNGYTIHGWELGNELSGHGVGTRIQPDQYAADVIKLKSMVDNSYADSLSKPLVLSPGGFFDATWFKYLIEKTKPNYMDVVTHHIYNLGPGVDTHLVSKILDPSYLNGEANTFRKLQQIIINAETSTTAWVGEAGGAYNSGHHLVTNAFVFSFWYLDQLGMSATFDTKTYCRQSLIGGNYGILNTTTYKPNPDYFSALLWHRLMGRRVLSATFNGTDKIRVYAHCSKQSKGVTLLLLNLDMDTTVYVSPSLGSNRIERPVEFPREEYHLTAKDGDLHSQVMMLNGKALITKNNGKIPALNPVVIPSSSQPIIVAPCSIVFAHFPYSFVPACI